MDKEKIVDKIERLRKQSGLTQQDIADRMDMTRPNYARLLKNPGSLAIRHMEGIAKALGVPANSLLLENYERLQQQEVLLNEFFEIAVMQWIHEHLTSILRLFNHDLHKDSLIIKESEHKKMLVAFLAQNVAYNIVSEEISESLEDLLINFFAARTLAIYFYSKKDMTIWVDLLDESGTRKTHRGYYKKHEL